MLRTKLFTPRLRHLGSLVTFKLTFPLILIFLSYSFRNSIPGSAICAFNMSAIETTFLGNFKAQRHTGSAWERDSSQHRSHFQCEAPRHPNVAYAESNRLQLMDDAVQPSTSRPLYTADLETLSHIAVEVISTKLHSEVRILYVASTDGLIKKISILPRTQQSCVVGVWATNSSVLTLQVLPNLSRILVGLKNRVMSIPTSQCGRHRTRASCARAMDPHCGWNEVLQQCTTAPDGNPLSLHWHQSVTECPILSGPVDGGWSSWSPWFTCSHLGNAVGAAEESTDKCKCRTRQCNNPAPRDGGANCSGVSIAVTNCTVKLILLNLKLDNLNFFCRFMEDGRDGADGLNVRRRVALQSKPVIEPAAIRLRPMVAVCALVLNAMKSTARIIRHAPSLRHLHGMVDGVTGVRGLNAQRLVAVVSYRLIG